MRRGTVALLAGLCMSALLAGGCAQKEVVKEEQPPVTQTTPAPQPETKRPTPPPVEQKAVEQPKQQEDQRKVAPPQQEAQAVTEKQAQAEANFETVYFDFDKSDLRQDARDALYKNAEILLKQKSNAKVKIEGHCDERGSAEYNLALGERRAKSALQYLLTLGVPAERMSIISYGKEKPATQGNDESAWAKNRRAEFVIVK